jgi:hypothetical protein
MDSSNLLSGLIGALVGSVIGGLATFWSTRWATYKTQNNLLTNQRANQAIIIKGVLQAIHDEVETIWDQYLDVIGHVTEAHDENEPFIHIYPLHQDYFTVYNSNGIFIGQIPDSDLRKAIVTTYTKARGLIDSYLLNNADVQRYFQLSSLASETNNEYHYRLAAAVRADMAAYSKQIKIAHKDTAIAVADLLRRLRKEGVLAEGGTSQGLSA